MSIWRPGSTPTAKSGGWRAPRAPSWAPCGITPCPRCLSGARDDVAWLARDPAAPRFTVHFLLLARAVMAALVPLTADEAYYWLWSRHLDAGYLDHPPAIAWLIRAGTMLFGDTPIGRARRRRSAVGPGHHVRLGKRPHAFEKRSARLHRRAAVQPHLDGRVWRCWRPRRTCRPSSPARGCFFAWCGCRTAATPNGGSGRASPPGLSLLSKYSALFEIAGVFLWLIISPRQRKWLATPWPWAGAMLALLVFAPNLYWQTLSQLGDFRLPGQPRCGSSADGALPAGISRRPAGPGVAFHFHSGRCGAGAGAAAKRSLPARHAGLAGADLFSDPCAA